ncbi:MAG TPA: hypothetical protein VGB42_08630 [Candidatus Thermoplasmatota archaeon]
MDLPPALVSWNPYGGTVSMMGPRDLLASPAAPAEELRAAATGTGFACVATAGGAIVR